MDAPAQTAQFEPIEVAESSSEAPPIPEVTANVDSPPPETGEEKESSMTSDDVKEWLKDVRPDTTKEVEKKGGPSFKVVLILIAVTVLIGALVGGVFYYQKGISGMKEKKEEPAMQEVFSTTTPTPTPEEKVDLTSYSVSVQNGSGIKGEAAKVKGLLTAKGFAEDKITAGNADSSDYTQTSVSLKESVPDKVFDTIKEALGEGFDVVKSEKPLDKDSKHDLVVIVGKKKE